MPLLFENVKRIESKAAEKQRGDIGFVALKGSLLCSKWSYLAEMQPQLSGFIQILVTRMYYEVRVKQKKKP